MPESSSKFVVRMHPSSSTRSSRVALMKPESGGIGRGGSTGLERLVNLPSMAGGEDGIVN
jgi:hypothetical protein